jgi:hypothetical protein
MLCALLEESQRRINMSPAISETSQGVPAGRIGSVSQSQHFDQSSVTTPPTRSYAVRGVGVGAKVGSTVGTEKSATNNPCVGSGVGEEKANVGSGVAAATVGLGVAGAFCVATVVAVGLHRR